MEEALAAKVERRQRDERNPWSLNTFVTNDSASAQTEARPIAIEMKDIMGSSVWASTMAKYFELRLSMILELLTES